MKSLFSSQKTDVLNTVYVGVMLPFKNEYGPISESPIRWLQITRDISEALVHDGIESDYLLDKLINIHAGKRRLIRLTRIVAVTISDFDHMRCQSSLPLKKQQDFRGSRSQFILPERLLNLHVYDALTYLYHDYLQRSRQTIYQDAVFWQRSMAQNGSSSALTLHTLEEHDVQTKARRLHFKTIQAKSGYIESEQTAIFISTLKFL